MGFFTRRTTFVYPVLAYVQNTCSRYTISSSREADQTSATLGAARAKGALLSCSTTYVHLEVSHKSPCPP